MSGIKVLDEINAITRLNAGDKGAFNLLFDNYAKKIFCYSLSLTHNKEDAEEIVQETFMKVWENRTKIKTDLSFNAYVITISRNLIYNKIKRRVLEKSIFDYFMYSSSYIENVDFIEDSDFSEAKNRIINQLPERRRQIIILRKQGYSNDEVAEMLHISKSTVSNQINKAIKELQGLLSKISLMILAILF